MKKNLVTKNLSLIALVTAAILFISCASAKQTVPTNVIETYVSAINKHGNCTLAISPEDFVAAGYNTGDIANLTLGNISAAAPVATSYSDVDGGNYIIRLRENEIIVAINLGNLASTSGVEVGSPVTISMKEKEGYLSQYEIRQLKHTNERSDYPSDEIFANFRAVKAGKIAENKLYAHAIQYLATAVHLMPQPSQYKIISQTIADMFKTLNNGKPVTNKNVKRVAENYLLNTVGLTQSELTMLKAALQ